MRIKSKTVASRILTFVLFLSMTLGLFATNASVVYADADAVKEVVEKYGAESFGSLISTDSSLAGNSEYTKIMVSDKSYWYRTNNEQAILNKANSLKGQAQIDKLDDYYNIEADIEGANTLVEGLKGPISTFLGVLVTFITVFMTVFTALDLCYIAFPVFRGKMDEAKANGTKGMTHRGKNGETKLTFITEDAQFAVINAETAQTGRSAYLIYFKQRVVSFIVLAILIFILLTGNINILTNIGVRLASGILEAISNSF